jgi:hypothetical protein
MRQKHRDRSPAPRPDRPHRRGFRWWERRDGRGANHEGGAPMPKLTDTQLVMLSAAAQRADGAVGLPENLKGAAAQKAAASLLREGLVEEVLAGRDLPAWRRDQSDQPVALLITSWERRRSASPRRAPLPRRRPQARGESHRRRHALAGSPQRRIGLAGKPTPMRLPAVLAPNRRRCWRRCVGLRARPLRRSWPPPAGSSIRSGASWPARCGESWHYL